MARIIKPRKLNPGDTIALIAPSWIVPPEQLNKGIEFLRNRGYKVKEYPQIRSRYAYFSGNDKMRADALMHAFSDKKVDAIFCVARRFRCAENTSVYRLQCDPKKSQTISWLLGYYGLITFDIRKNRTGHIPWPHGIDIIREKEKTIYDRIF